MFTMSLAIIIKLIHINQIHRAVCVCVIHKAR